MTIQYSYTLLRNACLLFMLLHAGACKKFLSEKPDQKFVIPTTLNDADILLNDYFTMNMRYSGEGEAAADNYYITDGDLSGLDVLDRGNYTWVANGLHNVATWQYPYKAVFNANVALEVVSNLEPDAAGVYNNVKGSALFFRAFALYQIAQLYAPPYDKSTADVAPGIPVRESADASIPSVRGTVQQTYSSMVSDLEQAATLLPETAVVKSRPNKAAAFAMLARTFLAMEEYVKAGMYADSCLKHYHALLDYAMLDTIGTTPAFTRFNDEVVFTAVTNSTYALNPGIAHIDTMLYRSYASGDLRKQLFFKNNVGAEAFYRGGYDGTNTNQLFIGLAIDEVYLVRAECYARAGIVQAAMDDLNTLLIKRWNASFVPYTASDADDALRKILTERRKELIFRTSRWTDLRRLNKDSRFAKTLTRSRNTMPYTPLPPNDVRYTLLIPQEVIGTSGIAQNER
ncbi:hypothetical protein HNQ91_001822 [Filimonas zeae]|uniref:SusD family protein n=1 Tax=Filimonas zeae TaxID=1737353 RepID=A0A917MXG6_9BACT|nr:RagB/SusD family nutrient uptake outer membrane protein [Filimonas zeae]MDR6338771.1 hypothetical protein [Filimonas zeae]GGH66696.1 hypothetical protein GCM10011379_21130 [Filimonas zeae]